MCAERLIHVRSSGCSLFRAASSNRTQIKDALSCSCRFAVSGHAACATAQNAVKPAAPTNFAEPTAPPSMIEPPRAAEVAAAGDKKTQPFFGSFGQSNADALTDRLDLVTIAADPKLPIGKQIQTVVTQVDPQCRRQAPRPARQVS